VDSFNCRLPLERIYYIFSGIDTLVGA